jgi:hypothetical protein
MLHLGRKKGDISVQSRAPYKELPAAEKGPC